MTPTGTSENDIQASVLRRAPSDGDCEENPEKEAQIHLLSGPYDNTNQQQSSDSKTSNGDIPVELEIDIKKPLMYRISENPPVHLLVLFAIQQALLGISAPLGITMLASEVVCAQKDDALKIDILSASFFMSGLCTFAMSTFGVRLPIFQGPASPYLVPLLAMAAMPEWKCPETFQAVNPADNSTVLVAVGFNGSHVPARELILSKITALSGSLMLAGVLHFLIGLTGLVGVILRYVGPITIVPTIVLVGLYTNRALVKFCQPSWLLTALTCLGNFILSMYLANKNTPIPIWSRTRGFHILWFPFHHAFSVLLSIIFGWLLSLVLTTAGAFTDDPSSLQYQARSDARLQVMEETDWFIFPYPGKFGPMSFSAAGFISFFVATIMSVLDSIGDYNACARAVRAPPPPTYAFNRGIAVEGFMSMLSGSMGCCHATVSYGGNIGAINMTGVASRSVMQACGLVFIIFGVIGKAGALFITIPYPVLGGITFIMTGIFIGLVLSYLQFVDLNSTRNLAIVGMALLMGMMLPYWIEQNPDAIETGNAVGNNVIRVLLSNSSFVGGFFACVLDNTVPGTLKERGLMHQLKELNDEEAKEMAKKYEDGEEVYRLPFVPDSFRRSKLAKYIPIVDYQGKH
ncbi:hypothetical protein BsWGS_01024 [Bradybaena similaris]